MSITASIWLIILAALVAANLPFINQRLAIVGPVMPDEVERHILPLIKELQG